MKNKPNQITPGGFIWTLSIIHLGLTIGPIVFGVLCYRKIQTTIFSFSDTDNMFLIVVPVFALSCILVGSYIFSQSVKNIPRTGSLKQRLTQFQTASIINYALIEAASLFGIIAFIMTQNLVFLLLSAIILLYFFMLRPTKEKIARILNLKGSDRDRLNKLNQPLE